MDSLETLAPMPVAAVDEALAPTPTDASIFLGWWVSTNRQTQGIAEVVIRDENGRLFVRAFGSGDSLCDWGETSLDVFVDGPDSTRAYAFHAQLDLGFKETALQAKVEKGVLVIANFNRFKDGSGRPSYYSREFFFRRSPGFARSTQAGVRS
jgi:hypothetical protein